MSSIARRVALRQGRTAFFIGLTFLLTACAGTSRMGDLLRDSPIEASKVEAPIVPALPDRIALLLPLTGPNDLQRTAASMKRAAEMALIEQGQDLSLLLIKDTKGSADTAALLASEAISEGARLILGPVLANEVQSVSPVAAAAGINVIAFSNMSGTATTNTFLMGFLPEEEVAAVARYAKTQGITSIALLQPNSQYGSIVNSALQRNVTNETPSVAVLYPRQPSAVAGPAAEVAKSLTQPNAALLLPEGGQMLRSIGLALATNKIDPTKVRILGTSIWQDGLTPTTPIAKNGWFATVAPELVLNFEQKYIVGGANPPPLLASLSYDAAHLALKLYRNKNYSVAEITDRQGFSGANGAYRFLSTGMNERKLTIMQMTPLGPTVLSPAENSFN